MGTKSHLVFVFLIFNLFLTGGVYGGWEEKYKLIASDGASGDLFGSSVSISGDYAIVGAYRSDECCYDSGSAYIYKRENGQWEEKCILTGSDISVDSRFGISVSMRGDFAIVGAYRSGINNTGTAYIFKREGDVWLELAKLCPYDAAVEDYFGCSVCIGEDYAIVGASQCDVNEVYNSGAAYIFEIPTGFVGDVNQAVKLTASDFEISDRFGVSVGISGEYAVVGAYQDDVNGVADCGSVYVFKKAAEGWGNCIEVAKLTASEALGGDYFGVSVGIDGDCIVVGGHKDDTDKGVDSGAAYIFKRYGEDWTERALLVGSDISEYCNFGCSVAIDGDYVVVGGNLGGDDGIGSAYVFKQTECLHWIEDTKLDCNDCEFSYNFGFSVDIDNGFLIAGSNKDSFYNSNRGSAYVFEKMICPVGDFDGDCCVDFFDYSLFASSWLREFGDDSYSAAFDISLVCDDVVDLKDLFVFADSWLSGVE